MGIGILWIMLYHAPEINIVGIREFQSIGYIGIELFLFLSSFGLFYAFNKNKSIKYFYKRRFLRILPYYLPILLLRVSFDANNINDIFSLSFLWIHAYFKLWYVPFILVLYLITPLYLLLFYKEPKKITIIAIIIAFAFSFIAYGKSSLFIATARIPIFLLGFYIAYKEESFKEEKLLNNKLLFNLFIVIISYGTQIILINKLDNQMLAECGFMWFPAFFGTFSFIQVLCRGMRYVKYVKIIEKIFAWCGKLTLEIYLIHQLLYDIICQVVNGNGLIIYSISICITLLICNLYQGAIMKCMRIK